MTAKLEYALTELADALKSLKSDTLDEAIDAVCDSEDAIAQVVDRTLRVELCGVKYKSKHPSLTVTILDADSAREYFFDDPIQGLIDGYGDPTKYVESRAAFDRAYAALQSGIDRLKAYEAECLKAQS